MKYIFVAKHNANYTIPDWAMERFNDIEDYILTSMTTIVETDQMKRLYSGNQIFIHRNILKSKSMHTNI